MRQSIATSRVDRVRRLVIAMVAVTCAMAGSAVPAEVSAVGRETWVASWASSAIEAPDWWADWGYQTGGFDMQTLRHVVHTSVGGSAVQITLSNHFGTNALHVGRVTVGVSAEPTGSTAAVDGGSIVPVTFDGSPHVSIAPGEVVTSDAIGIVVPADHDLAVSMFFPAPTGRPSGHLWAGETSFFGPGDLTSDVEGSGFAGTTSSSYYVTAVDVRTSEADGSVVVLGDSLSDGILAIAPDSGLAWPDVMFDRIRSRGKPRLAVVNVAFAGNAVHPESDPNSALARFDRDVLQRSGVTTVVVLLGTNDIGGGRTGREIVAGLREMIKRTRAAGIKIVGATIPPMGNAVDGTCPTPPDVDPDDEATRQYVNSRIRPGGPESLRFNAVVDVDAVLRNPQDQTRIQCDLSFLGNFHPGVAGHEAMAYAVDLDALEPR